MQYFLNKLEWIVSRCGFALLIIMSIVICLQVFMRYIINNSLMWPEELTRYCYLWCSMFAIAVTEQKRAHLRIDIINSFSIYKLKKILDFFACIITTVFYGIFIYLSIQMTFMVIDMEQYAISFDLPMVYVWIGFPILGVIALIFSFANIGNLLKSLKNG